MLEIPSGLQDRLIGLFRQMKESFEGGEDVRHGLAMVPSVQSVVRGLVEISDNEDTRFAAILIHEFLGFLEIYDGRTDRWYEINERQVSQLRDLTSRYFGSIIEALSENDLNSLVEATKRWFNEFHNATRATTADVRRR